jgi:hypothetical protein
MDSHEERMAKRAAERAALEAELDREDAERRAAATDPAAAVVSRREGNALRSAAFLVGIILLATALFGTSLTLMRWPAKISTRPNAPVMPLSVFTSADIGADVRVGDLGEYRTSKKLAREDTAQRPWLIWIGFVVGFLGVVPGLLAVLIVRELLRFRRR